MFRLVDRTGPRLRFSFATQNLAVARFWSCPRLATRRTRRVPACRQAGPLRLFESCTALQNNNRRVLSYPTFLFCGLNRSLLEYVRSLAENMSKNQAILWENCYQQMYSFSLVSAV